MPKNNREKILLSAPLNFDADGDDSLPQKVNGVAYSGGKVSHYENLVIDLDSTTVAEAMPILFQHNHSATVGVVSNAENNGSNLVVAGTLFSDIDDDAAAIAKKSKAGLQYQMSIGLFDYSYERVNEGKTVTVNGNDLNGPITVLRNGIVREVSIVALGADPETEASVFQAKTSLNNSMEGDMPGGNKTQLELFQEKNTELAAALKTATDKVAELQAAIDKSNKAKRIDEVKKLFEKTGQEFSEDAARNYIEMPSELFESISADMLKMAAAKPDLPDALFKEFATGDVQDGDVDYLAAAVDSKFGQSN